MTNRVLSWEGCGNVRDLGGLQTESGGETRAGAVVRSDNVCRLTPAGWRALHEHGVRTIIDLRADKELVEDPPGDMPIEPLRVSLFGLLDGEYLRELEERIQDLPPDERIRELYLDALERHRDSMARAVALVADAPEGGVLVHCAAGKDRTGLVAALLLRLAGVRDDVIVEDYAASHPVETPPSAMEAVLAALDERYGSVREYLLGGGANPEQLERAAQRLR
jgi:protein-tyrosine phosphatase